MTTKTQSKPAPKKPAAKPASRARKAKAIKRPSPAKKPTPANVPPPRGKGGKPQRGEPTKSPTPSALDSAALVLADAPIEGMSAKEMVEAMAAKGLWTSPVGKTPEATVYAGILREIGRKGKAARFHKVSRGRFTLAQTAS